ncbi:hypothetical protein ACOME3_008947 [Neoechinorhynchus agilis]
MSSWIITQYGDGWCSFDDLDTFDPGVLLEGLIAPVTENSVWGSGSSKKYKDVITITSRRQMESMFNLGHLLMSLYFGRMEGQTFRDVLSMQSRAVDLVLENPTILTQYKVLKRLCESIVESGGLLVILKMIKNPIFPRVRLSAILVLSVMISNVKVADWFASKGKWFLNKIVIWLINTRISL